MRVVTKLMLALTAGQLVLMGVFGFMTVRREMAYFNYDMRRDARTTGHALAATMVQVWNADGSRAAIDILAAANTVNNPMKLVWLSLDSRADDGGIDETDRRLLMAGQDVFIEGGLAAPTGGGVGGGGSRGNSLCTIVPVSVRGITRGAILLEEPLGEVRAYTLATVVRVSLLSAAIAALGGVLAWMLGSWIVGRPISRLAALADRVGSGALGASVELRTRDELGGLAASLNTMSAQLAKGQERLAAEVRARMESMEKLRHADRLATVGRLAAGVAHELGTPLNVVSGRARLIEKEPGISAATNENASIIREQTARITGIVRQLMDLARRRNLNRSRVDLRELSARVLKTLGPIWGKGGGGWSLDGDQEPVIVNGDAAQLEQVLTNLIVNAVQAMPDGGRLGVRATRVRAGVAPDLEGSERLWACVSVQDEGHGIAPEILEHLFEPFLTTKEVGQGTGLGLAVAQGIVQEHGGWIRVSTKVGEGTRFDVLLPVPDEPSGDPA